MIKTVTIPILFSISTLLTGCDDTKLSAEQEVLISGESIVKKNCFVCHAQGINGAPIIGNKKMWEPRIKKGKETLIENATNGFGLMPARAGNSALTDEDITLAVSYMMSQVDSSQ